MITTNSSISMHYMAKLWKYRSQSFTIKLVSRENVNSFLNLNHDMLLCAEIEVVYSNNIGHVGHVDTVCISNMFKKKMK